MLRPLRFIIAFLLFAGSHIQAAPELYVYPSADLSKRPSVSGVKPGKEPALVVDKYSQAFLRFSTASLVPGEASGLSLQLTLSGKCAGTISVKGVLGAWSEGKASKRPPRPASPLYARSSLTVSSKNLILDLPATLLENENIELSLVANGKTRCSFYSRESSRKPRLKISRSVTPTPTGTPDLPVATPTPTATPTITPTPTATLVPLTIKRGPYIQRVSPTGVKVRWRTAETTDTVVRFGISREDLNLSALLSAATREHNIAIGDLTPSTRYYYTVGTSLGPSQAASADQYFVTAPTAGTRSATRIWVLGDSGTGDVYAMAVRDAYAAYSGSAETDLWLMVGDNAYENGLDIEFQYGLFDIFQTFLRNAPLWPAPGNHDLANSLSPKPYYDNFSLPQNAEAGGAASHSEAYYSFDYANIHFVSLDSDSTNRSTSGAMYNWLVQDLDATNQDWIIAYWHHPPFSGGSHTTDTDINDVEMRNNFMPLLYSKGADLLLSGHNHTYERSYLLDGFTGIKSQFNNSYVVQLDQAGQPDAVGPYLKPLHNANSGIICVVPGNSGKLSSNSVALNHPAMVPFAISGKRGIVERGSFVIDTYVDGDGNLVLDAKELSINGQVLDSFQIKKPPS